MSIIKRSRASTTHDLITAVRKLCPLLEAQNEFEAVKDLKDAADQLGKSGEGTKDYSHAIRCIIDAFDGEHELIAYTHQRDTEQWTEVEELSQVSSRVLSLARRLAT